MRLAYNPDAQVLSNTKSQKLSLHTDREAHGFRDSPHTKDIDEPYVLRFGSPHHLISNIFLWQGEGHKDGTGI